MDLFASPVTVAGGLLLLGLFGLVAGGELLVSGAVRLARCLGMPPLLIGLTVVAFGTSTPELFVSVAALLRGADGVMLGNVIGSNIANVGLILGFCALLVPLPVAYATVRRELLLLLGVGLLLVLFTLWGRMSRWAGLLFVVTLIAYTWDAYRRGNRQQAAAGGGVCSYRPRDLALAGLRVVVGLVLLMAGSNWFIDGAVRLARLFHVSELVIGLTLAAVGTSLPELAASFSAIRRRQHAMLVGNVIGSNLFNLLMVLGFAGLVRPFPLPRDLLVRDLPVMVGMSLLLMPVLARGDRVRRWQGGLFFAAYLAYLWFLA